MKVYRPLFKICLLSKKLLARGLKFLEQLFSASLLRKSIHIFHKVRNTQSDFAPVLSMFPLKTQRPFFLFGVE
ncbi:hypothetical protein ATS75_08090 [Pseudoalteromonas sp. H105]|jgi:hypothetical protein|nr:hypothetical protein ATS75_08090 [Pseudoalteromonas sp. H105]